MGSYRFGERMSGWNHRVVYHPPSTIKVGEKEYDIGEHVAIHEVYYDDNGIPNAMTLDEIVSGEEGMDSLRSLRWILEHQLKALDKPILSDKYEDGKYKEISQEKQNEFIKGIEDEEEIGSEDSDITDGHTEA